MVATFRHRNLPQLLLQSREELMQRFRPLLNKNGISEQQWRIVRALLDAGELEPRQLGEMCLISSPSIAGVLTRMEDSGLIERQRMPHDQRRVKVTLTVKAKKLAKNLTPHIEQQYQALEKTLGIQQLQSVYDALDTLLKNMENLNEKSPDDCS
ncbi:MAG TPA: homoprotocatechuate degradation operon regulator HpaR [Burkholderiaceae bacterium]|nr:homoprotocatechuate degradation operon regulator HpaR [Burkholderiaceae bacterium]